MLSATTNLTCGMLFIGISVPLVLGKIPMNFVFGIRFSKAFDSEENWYKINRYGGKQIIVWSIPLILLGLGAAFLPSVSGLAPEQLATMDIFLAMAPVIVLIPTFTSWRYAQKL